MTDIVIPIVKSELVDEIVKETPTDFPMVKTETVVPVDKTPGSFYAEVVKKKKINVCIFIMKDLSILMMIFVIKL